jgi:putative transposase
MLAGMVVVETRRWLVNGRAQQVGLFRYSLVRELASERLSGRERGAMARGLAAREHIGPDGLWLRCRAPRSTGGCGRILRAGSRRWFPRRGGSRLARRRVCWRWRARCGVSSRPEPRRRIHRILVETEGWLPSARRLQRHLAAAVSPWKGASPAQATGRFEAGDRNELWTGDALHGLLAEDRKDVPVRVHR